MSTSDEFSAFQAVFAALEPLEDDARERVMKSVATLMGVSKPVSEAPKPTGDEHSEGVIPTAPGAEDAVGEDYGEFAELFAAANPSTNPEKALVAAYWAQICEKQENFGGQGLNSALKDLGHGLSNITDALSALIGTKPQLVLQLKKSGGSKQARKTYKLSKAGETKVEEMISAAE